MRNASDVPAHGERGFVRAEIKRRRGIRETGCSKSRKRKDAAAPAAPPKPTREEELLTEIRDLLKKA